MRWELESKHFGFSASRRRHFVGFLRLSNPLKNHELGLAQQIVKLFSYIGLAFHSVARYSHSRQCICPPQLWWREGCGGRKSCPLEHTHFRPTIFWALAVLLSDFGSLPQRLALGGQLNSGWKGNFYLKHVLWLAFTNFGGWRMPPTPDCTQTRKIYYFQQVLVFGPIWCLLIEWCAYVQKSSSFAHTKQFIWCCPWIVILLKNLNVNGKKTTWTDHDSHHFL